MYKLHFDNGNVQTFESYSQLCSAVNAFGGTLKCLGGKDYAFIPKK